MCMPIFDDMNLALLKQIAGKRNSVPVDRVIFLQHWAAFIQPVDHTLFRAFLKAICISYHHGYHLIASCNCEVRVWLSVFTVLQDIRQKLVVMFWLRFEPNYAKFLAHLSSFPCLVSSVSTIINCESNLVAITPSTAGKLRYTVGPPSLTAEVGEAV